MRYNYTIKAYYTKRSMSIEFTNYYCLRRGMQPKVGNRSKIDVKP